MKMKEYYLKFNLLSKYAPDTMADPKASMTKFFTGISSLVVKECRTTMHIGDVDRARLMMCTADQSREFEGTRKSK